MNKINLYFSKALVIVAAVFIASSCSKDTENWGYVSKFSNINEVVANQSTREDVVAKLGSPTSKSVYGKEKWFYIGSEVTKESFFDPKVLNHEVYTIVFSNEGVVESITKRGKDDMNEVALSNDTTVTEGNEVTITQQFLGNLGKFNKDGGGRRSGPTTRMPRY